MIPSSDLQPQIAAALADLRAVATADAYMADAALRDRHHAAEDALIGLGAEAVPALIAALREPSWGARHGAIYCLTTLRDVRAVQPFIDALCADDVSERVDLIEGLLSIGTISVRPLIHALTTQDDENVLTAAALALRQFRDPLAVPALLAALDHAVPSVRAAAVDALGALRDARAVEPLIAALGADPAPEVREGAARALGALAETLPAGRIRPALIAALRDADWGARQSAAEMLIALDETQSADALALLWADLMHPDAEVRLGAAYGLVLAEQEPAAAADTLIRLVHHPDEAIAVHAITGLGLAGDRRAVPVLEALRDTGTDAVRHAADAALTRLRA